MKLPEKIAFVDIETTGLNSQQDRIIEIGVVRMEKGQIVRTWQTLIDPQTHIPPEISTFTGIKPEELSAAPTFRQIAETVEELLEDCIFSAHNARFDYSFLKSEFKRLGEEFKYKQLCTVRLSRILFPNQARHNLDAICEKHNLIIENRHRAMDDALAICQFYSKILTQIGRDTVNEAVNEILTRPSIPQNLNHLDIDNLPEKPGVYIFYGESGMPIYVGKSVNIKSRVLSHLTEGLSNASEMRLYSQVTEIETEVCSGELHALLREAELIKELKPLHNRQLRQAQEIFVIKIDINELGYKIAKICRGQEPEPNTIGNFRNMKSAADFLRQKCTNNNLCEKFMDLEKLRRRCFNSDLGKCQACSGQEDKNIYNLRFDLAMAGNKFPKWPFESKILVKEGNKNFVFDNWKYENRPFDIDTYNILKRYIFDRKNERNIKVLGSQDIYNYE